MSGFRFRQFAISQDRCAMKVGTDGVLLGAWAETGSSMLDIGTGTGLIALMLAQRRPDARVDAIEIDESAALQARENVAASPFADRVRVERCRVQDFQPSDGGGYDAIVSNPPYFQNALGSPDGQRHQARHTDSLTYRELCDAVVRLLAPDGLFSVILPFDCIQGFMDEATLHGLVLTRECAVHTTLHKPARRYMLTFSRGMRDEERGVRSEEQVLTDSDGNRSEWYARLTRDFYL